MLMSMEFTTIEVHDTIGPADTNNPVYYIMQATETQCCVELLVLVRLFE